MKYFRLLAPWLLVFLVPPITGSAQTVRTWNGGATASAPWHNTANWLPTGIPTGSNGRAIIDGGLAPNADVLLNQNETIGGLTISFGDKLSILGGVRLTLNRGGGFSTQVSNAGTIAVGTGELRLDGSATLNGFGTATLAGGSITATNPPVAGTPIYDLLDNLSTIQGHGTVQPAVNNQELIQANIAGQTLTLQAVESNSDGILEAINGGTLVIQDHLNIGPGGYILNSGGVIRAQTGSTVLFNGGIQDGQIRNNGGTFKSVGGAARWIDLAITAGKIGFEPNAALPASEGKNVLTLEGTLTNAGEVVFEGTHATGQSLIAANGPVRFQGGGSLKLRQGGPGTGGPVSFERLNYDDESLYNGKAVPEGTPVVAADRHTIEGAANIQLEVVNERSGSFRSPVGAVAPLSFQNTLINKGEITSSTALEFAGIYGFSAFNYTAGVINTTSGTFALDSMSLTNYGQLLLQGGTEGTMAGSFINHGAFEISGNSTLTNSSSSFSNKLENHGTLKILDTSSVTLGPGGVFKQTDTGTLVFGIQSDMEHASLNTESHSGVLGGKITAQFASGFTPAIGTTFSVIPTGIFSGRFKDAMPDLPGSVGVRVVYSMQESNPFDLVTGVSLEVVPAQKFDISTAQTVNGFENNRLLLVKAVNGAVANFVESGDVTSFGLKVEALLGQVNLNFTATSAMNILGDMILKGNTKVKVEAGARVSAYRIQSDDATVALEGALQAYVDNGNASRIQFKDAETGGFDQDGTLASALSQSFQRSRDGLATNGVDFDFLRLPILDRIQMNFPQEEINEAWVTEVTRIVALGGNNLLEVTTLHLDDNVEKQALNLKSGVDAIIASCYQRVRDFHLGTNPQALEQIAQSLVAGNNHFSNPNLLLPVVQQIVAVGGGNYAPDTYNRAANIVANGGGNFTDPIDFYQAATIIAMGGDNIVAVGGANFSFVDTYQLLPQISASISAARVSASIIANGGGNIIALGGANIIANGGGNLTVSGDRRLLSRAHALAASPPGSALNTLAIDGNFLQSKQGLTQLQIPSSSTHDQIIVTGKATLDGSLTVLFANPDDILNPNAFAPTSGSSFDIIIAPEFEIMEGFQLRLPGLAAGRTWEHEFVDLGNGTVALRLHVNGPPAVTFSDWATAAGLSGNNTLPTATPHHDGVPNLLKYAFNLNGDAADLRVHEAGSASGGLPAISRNGSTLRVQFLRRIGSGLVYTPKKSTSLLPGSWLPLTDVPDVVDLDGVWEQVTYDEPFPPEGTSQLFGAVDVMMP